MKMEHTECSETSAYKIQTPGNHPEESIQHSERGESLKSRSFGGLFLFFWYCFILAFFADILMYLNFKGDICLLLILVSVFVHFLVLLWPGDVPSLGRNLSPVNKTYF
jgi:hypothetical protein